MNNNYHDLVIEGLQNPSKIPTFLRRKYAEKHTEFKHRNSTKSLDKIEGILSDEELLLIIFDTCRYDYFEQLYPDHYTGDLECVYTTNTCTMQYLACTWQENMI